MEKRLADVLCEAPPEGIQALSDEQQQVLADVVRQARRNQAAALAKAGDESLKYVPAPLRGAVRKAIGL